MPRILAIDYGKKRCGLAVTDLLQIAAHPLETVSTPDLLAYLNEYLKKEEVEAIVLGKPSHPDGQPLDITNEINKVAARIQKDHPGIGVFFQNENYTSRRAAEILVEAGVPKHKRREKGRLDLISAVLILQEYLGHI